MKTLSVYFINVFADRIKEWLTAFVEHTPNIIIALLVFLLGFYSARIIKKVVVKILRLRGVKPSARNMTANIVSIAVVVIFFLAALNILNLDNILTTILAGAGVAGLVIGLALQGTLSNTFSGMTLSFIRDLRIGDQVETNGYVGVIEDINLRVVKLRTMDDNLVFIPNKMIIENPLKNYSYNEVSRIKLSCGVAYNSDLPFVKELVISTIRERVPQAVASAPVVLTYTEFADSSINFDVRFSAVSKTITEIAMVKSDAIMAIRAAFNENGINIPFPIRTLDIPKEIMNKL